MILAFFMNAAIDQACEKQITEHDMWDQVEARARTEPELAVIIEADTDVRHGRVVDVMDAARLAGVGKLAIAVTPRETKR
jgi:biopolymer transport protein ExbD